MYSNVDAVIKFFKLLVKWSYDNMKMNKSQAYLCVFYKLDDKHELMLMVIAVIDECATTGLHANAEWFMNEHEGMFKITRGGMLRNSL